MIILAVAFGGAVGSVLRFVIGGTVQRRMHSGFPFGTLAVNILGCFLMGILLQRFMNAEPSSNLRALLVIGFCGGFTTFSAFSSETIGLLAGGANTKALLYVIASISLSLFATAIGLIITRVLTR